MIRRRAVVLFSPCYAEPLKAMLPYMRAVAAEFDVFVLNTISWVGDRKKSERLITAAEFPFASEDEWSDSLQWHSIWLRALRALDFRARRLTGGFIEEAILGYARENRWRRIARQWLDKLRPVALVVGGEQNPIQKHLIHECNRRGIPSITLQWGIANASVRHTREMLERAHKRQRAATRLRTRMKKKLAGALAEAAVRTAGLRVAMPSRIFGGGHATVFAVIGKGCFENYVEMGVPARKMAVIGYPIYEDLYRSAERLISDTEARARLFERFGLDKTRRLILWCTNDQRGYYAGSRSYDQMLESWRRKLQILLDLTPDSVVIKLHPKELLGDYLSLAAMSERVHLVCDESSTRAAAVPPDVSRVHVVDFDVREIIPHAALVITRFSGTAVDALCLGRQVITHNSPPIPGGTLYEDLGGTLHAKSDEEFAAMVRGLLVDGDMIPLAEEARREFLARYVRLDGEPAVSRFVALMKDLTTPREGPACLTR